MQVAVITLFPGMFSALSEYGITSRAVKDKKLQLHYFNPRDYTADRHRTVDDKPYGGGPGMLMKTGPLSSAIKEAQEKLQTLKTDIESRPSVIYLSPQGMPLTQSKVQELAERPNMVLLCGRYEGVDERVLESLVDEEYSLGDFVLSGGELAAMALLDSVVRLLPGALGDAASAQQDSFAEGLLDHPHYTRPEDFEGQAVPPILLSGDHAKIDRWRLQQRLGATWRKRPDLLRLIQLTPEHQRLLDEYISEYEAKAQSEPSQPD